MIMLIVLHRNYHNDHTPNENENENENENNYYNLLDEDDEYEKIVLSGEKTRIMEINEHNKIRDDYADGYDTEEEWSDWELSMGGNRRY